MDWRHALSSFAAVTGVSESGMHLERWKRGLGICVLAALLLASTGCGLLFTRHKVAKLPMAPMKKATLQQLVEIFNRQTNAITTMNAKVDLVASTGGARSGTVTQYRDIIAYLLVRKPSDIRLVGQFSLIGTLFDMASDGTTFQLNLPTKGQFIVGHNNIIPAHVKNPLEKLRPQVILQALLINPIAPNETVAAMNDNADTAAEYTMLVLRPDGKGIVHLVRKITFSRYDLLPRRQVIYDDQGFVATRASYGQYALVQGVEIPMQIVIERPAEEYSLRLTVQKMTLNQPLGLEKFHLNRPPNEKLIQLSQNGPEPLSTLAGN